ncbi:MAG: GTP 3',8-cyclase MoaA [bacterium]
MLLDSCGREIDYLRLSVTDRCNLNCIYCSPKEVHWHRRGEILSYEEMVTLIDITASMGVKRVRLTGGEPLLRRDFVSFIEKIASLGRGLDLSLTTNGILLPEMAADVFRAGLGRINISLDTLDEEKYGEITGADALQRVLHGIEVALGVGFDPLKLNVVVVKGLNDDEVDSFVKMAESKPVTVRFIEFMPGGVAQWDRSRLIPSSVILERLRRDCGLTRKEKGNGGGPSVDYSSPRMAGRIGFISSVTEPSCETCNRLRVTAEGKLRPCLFSENEFDLKAALRGKNPEEDVKRAVLNAVQAKPRGHLLQDSCGQTGRPMAQIGG